MTSEPAAILKENAKIVEFSNTKMKKGEVRKKLFEGGRRKNEHFPCLFFADFLSFP